MHNSIVAKLLSLAGLTGNSPSTNTLIPPSRDSVQAIIDQRSAGEIDNPDIWSSYNSAMSRPRTLEEQLRMWDEMSHWDLVAAALTEIVDEATQQDAYSPALLWYECSDSKAREELEKMVVDINIDEYVRSQVYHVAGYGNHFEKLDYSPGQGVTGFSYVHPLEIRRYWLRRNRKCVGFRWQGGKPDKTAAFKLGNLPEIPSTQLNLQKGNNSADMEQLWYPWDFLHFRRMYEQRQSEHGEPLFEAAQGIYKKLRIALDQMVVHRAQIQPDRYVMNIDVKDMPPLEQLKVVNKWKQQMRTKLSFGSGTTGIDGRPDEFRAFYSPMALDTILWMAKPRDFSHSIDKIAGTASVPDVHDIEMLTNLFFSIIGMPKSWLGFGDAAGKEGSGPVSGKALLAQDMRFLRKIKSIRQPLTVGYTWLGYFHLLLKGYDVSKIDLKACMPAIGSLEDQLKLELLDKQADVLEKLGGVMEKYSLPREVWIDLVFKKYMHLPSDVVDVFLTALPKEVEQPEESKKHAGAALKKVLEDVKDRLKNPANEIKDIEDILSGIVPKKNVRYRSAESILRPPSLQENDLIVAGFGSCDPLSDFKPRGEKEDNVTTRFISNKGYRDVMESHLLRKK